MHQDRGKRSRTVSARPPGDKAARLARSRKRTWQADAERARLAAIANSSFDAISGTDLDGITTYWNAAAERMYGYTADEAVGRHISLIVPDSRRDELEGILVRLRRGERAPPFETVRRRKDGSELTVSLAVSPMLGPDGTIIGASAIARDITERKRAEAALRANEQRLRLALDAGQLGEWDWDLQAGRGTQSLRTYQVYGYDAPFPNFTYATFLKHVLPEERRAVDRTVREAIRTQEPLHLECRIRRADGELRWIEVHGRCLPEASHMIGVVQDITERKRAEEALRDSGIRARAQLAELEAIYATSPVGMAVLDTELRYIRINERLAEINGASAAAHIGRTVREMVPDLGIQGEAVLRRILETGEPVLDHEFTGETPAVPGLRRHWIESWLPLRGQEGRIIGINVVVEEVTARKRAEENRELLIHELSHRVKNMLAVVQAMFKQSRRLSPSPEAFEAAFTGRIGAMAGAYSLLTRDRWEGTALTDVAAQVLEPFRQQAGHVAIQGQAELMLRPQAATTLAMVLHELATNAAKYGALSVGRGRVELTWTVEAADTGPVLDLRWSETDGPAVVEPRRQGFGRQLIERAVEYELGGAAEVSFPPTGVRCRMQIPLRPEVGSRRP